MGSGLWLAINAIRLTWPIDMSLRPMCSFFSALNPPISVVSTRALPDKLSTLSACSKLLKHSGVSSSRSPKCSRRCDASESSGGNDGWRTWFWNRSCWGCVCCHSPLSLYRPPNPSTREIQLSSKKSFESEGGTFSITEMLLC